MGRKGWIVEWGEGEQETKWAKRRDVCVCGYQCLTRVCDVMLHHIANDD